MSFFSLLRDRDDKFPQILTRYFKHTTLNVVVRFNGAFSVFVLIPQFRMLVKMKILKNGCGRTATVGRVASC